MRIGRLLARTLIGALFAAHGAQKLFGWFGGPGLTFNRDGGYEFNLALIAALLALVDGGPGPLSVDGALGIECTGGGWALASLAAGAAGSTAAVALGERQAASEGAAG